MATESKKVLLIEDDLRHINDWEEELKDDGYDVTYVESIPAARTLLEQDGRWDAIVFDGCIGGDDFNSPPLIKAFRAKMGEGCRMIAASSNPDLSKLMMDAGCTHMVMKKNHVPGMVHSLLRA
jgi:CheY-like chemotaxis protein